MLYILCLYFTLRKYEIIATNLYSDISLKISEITIIINPCLIGWSLSKLKMQNEIKNRLNEFFA